MHLTDNDALSLTSWMSFLKPFQAIKDLGLCPSASLSEIGSTKYRDFYWHSVGHWLGSDVHDTALISHSRQLMPGNVITIEPGLYIPDEERYGCAMGFAATARV